MTHNYVVPELDMFNLNHKRSKRQRTTIRQDEIKFFSPKHEPQVHTSRFYSPKRPNQLSSREEHKQNYNKSKVHQPKIETKIQYGIKSCSCKQYPSWYLDYPPLYGLVPSSGTQCQCQSYGFHDNQRRYQAEHDRSDKLDMYTQTSKLKQNYIQTVSPLNTQGDVATSNKQLTFSNNKFTPTVKVSEVNPEKPRQVLHHELTQQKFAIKEPVQGVDILVQDSSHCSDKFKPEKLPIPKSQSSIRGQDYKKTFSEAILDELFEKDLQQEYEQKYNQDKKYSQVIVGKIQRTVQIKKQQVQGSQSIDKYQILSSNSGKHAFPRSSGEQSQQKRQENEHIIYGQGNYNNNKKPQKNRQLHNENTINMLVNGQKTNYYNSPVQTIDQTNQNSRNQVIQTDNSQSALLIQRLVQNVIDDKEFRKRINQKKDQFDKIKIQYQPNLYVELQELIDSKDSYINYSKEFLAKLNHLIDNSTVTQRRKIISFNSQQFNTYVHPPPPGLLLPPKHTIISAVQIPIKHPPVHAPGPGRPHFIPPSSPYRAQHWPIVQYQAHPAPTQVVMQMPYRRLDIAPKPSS